MKLSRLKSIVKECFEESVVEMIHQLPILNSPTNDDEKTSLVKDLKEMKYFPELNIQYYAGENLKIPKLSKKYELFYKHRGEGFYTQGWAQDADMFDHYAFIIKNGIGTLDQDQFDTRVYTNPTLDPKDKQTIDDWSKKPEVKKRREFERKNFPLKNFPRDNWTGD